MELLIGSGVLWLITIIIYRNWWFVVCMTISTILALLRFKGVLFRYKVMVRWEIIGVSIPFLFSLVFKRFNLKLFILIIIARGLFLLLLKHDFNTFLYPRERITDEEQEG